MKCLMISKRYHINTIISYIILKKSIRICDETICYYIIMCHIFVINILLIQYYVYIYSLDYEHIKYD